MEHSWWKSEPYQPGACASDRRAWLAHVHYSRACWVQLLQVHWIGTPLPQILTLLFNPVMVTLVNPHFGDRVRRIRLSRPFKSGFQILIGSRPAWATWHSLKKKIKRKQNSSNKITFMIDTVLSAFKSSTWEAEAKTEKLWVWISLVYQASSKIARCSETLSL